MTNTKYRTSTLALIGVGWLLMGCGGSAPVQVPGEPNPPAGNKTDTVLPEGPCTLNLECEANFYCHVVMGEAEGTCEALVQNGDRCDEDMECASGYCDDFGNCAGCSAQDQCSPGATCFMVMGEAEGTCEALVQNGDRCDEDMECASGYCDDFGNCA